MWRFALSRRWWAGHLLVMAGCVLFLGLARWQWDRAHSISGDWQNLGYALQWPLFAAFLVAAWLRFLWLEQHRDLSPGDAHTFTRTAAQATTQTATPTTTQTATSPTNQTANRATNQTAAQQPTGAFAASGPAYLPTAEDDPDGELAAYNAYLAQLAAKSRQH